jgi:hypothetical protein
MRNSARPDSEHAGGADGPIDGGGAARVLDGGFSGAGSRLAGVMEDFAGGVGLAGDAAERLRFGSTE